MSDSLDLTLFAHMCRRPDAELDLAEAALLIAQSEYPGLDLVHYVRLLDELGREAKGAVDAAEAAGEIRHKEPGRLTCAVSWLFEEAGFHGNQLDYYDPKNSFLNDVLDRRTGIPITLGVVVLEVLNRAGIPAKGVSFPGHFLVRCDTQRGGYIVDPFTGKLLSRDDLKALYARSTGNEGEAPAKLLEPAPKRQILVRMLANLRGIYERREDSQRLRRVLERMQVLSPSEDVKRELVKLGGSAPWRSSGRELN